MNLRDLLNCFSCKSDELDFGKADLADPLNPEGSIRCESCDREMVFSSGVLIALEDVSANEKRNDIVYTDFWKRGDEVFKDQKYTHEDEVLEKWRPLMKVDRLMDAGCGSGRHVKKWIDFGAKEIVFLDISDSIYLCREHFIRQKHAHPALFIKASMKQIPLKDRAVDLSWSAGVVGLIDHQDEALKELCRISSKNIILGVLTDKTITGKIYIAANWVKPLVNRISNMRILFAFSGFMARLAYLVLFVLYKMRITTKFLRRETLAGIVKDKTAVKRIQYSLYDPIIIPKIIKHPDDYYISCADESGFGLSQHSTEIICDYYEFKSKEPAWLGLK